MSGGRRVFWGWEHLTSALWGCMDQVEMRFRSSERDQFRKGAVVNRVRVDPRGRLEAEGGGAVEVMIDLLSRPALLSLITPRWSPSVWEWILGYVTQHQASGGGVAASGGIGKVSPRGLRAALPEV